MPKRFVTNIRRGVPFIYFFFAHFTDERTAAAPCGRLMPSRLMSHLVVERRWWSQDTAAAAVANEYVRNATRDIKLFHRLVVRDRLVKTGKTKKAAVTRSQQSSLRSASVQHLLQHSTVFFLNLFRIFDFCSFFKQQNAPTVSRFVVDTLRRRFIHIGRWNTIDYLKLTLPIIFTFWITLGIKQRFPRLPNLLTFFFQGLKEANKTETTPPPLPTPFLIGLQEGAAAASTEIESTTLPPILPNVLNSYYNMEGETVTSSIALPYSGVDGQRRVGINNWKPAPTAKIAQFNGWPFLQICAKVTSSFPCPTIATLWSNKLTNRQDSRTNDPILSFALGTSR